MNMRGILRGIKALKVTLKVCPMNKGQPSLVWIGAWSQLFK